MGIRGRLLASHFILTLLVILLIGAVTIGRVRGYMIEAAGRTLVSQAEQVSLLVDRRQASPAERIAGLGGAVLTRLVSQLTAADVLIVGADGQVLYGSERLTRLVGAVFQADVLSRALATGQTGSDTFRDPLGRLSVFAVAPFSPGAGVAPDGAVVLVRPIGEVTRTTAGFLLLIGESLLLGLALSLVVSLLLSRGLTRPMLALEAGAERVASGDFGYRVPVEGDDEVGRVAEAFNTMALRLGALERERQELSASVSHELRTPVTSIKGFAQALLDNVGGPEERRRHAGIIIEEATRLERLVADLFQLARLEAGQVSFHWTTVDLAELVAGAVGKHQPRADELGVRLSRPAASDQERLPVRGDSDRLNQVLSNLIENALRFTPKGGRVEVTVGRDQARASSQPGPSGDRSPVVGAALVTVADSGPGIPEDEVGRVFERFYTVDRSRSRAKGGTGLGLSIAREIIEAHGGRIWAGRSGLGGALLSLTVPLQRHIVVPPKQ